MGSPTFTVTRNSNKEIVDFNEIKPQTIPSDWLMPPNCFWHDDMSETVPIIEAKNVQNQERKRLGKEVYDFFLNCSPLDSGFEFVNNYPYRPGQAYCFKNILG